MKTIGSTITCAALLIYSVHAHTNETSTQIDLATKYSKVERVAVVEEFTKCAARELMMAVYSPPSNPEIAKSLEESARGWMVGAFAVAKMFKLDPEIARPVFEAERERMQMLIMAANIPLIAEGTKHCDQFEPLKVDIVRSIKADIYAEAKP